MAKSTSEKLTALFTNETSLIKEVMRGEYKRKQRLRMVTITQSYSMTDSPTYVKARRMRRIMEREDAERNL